MNLHKFPISIESPVCTTCGEPLPEDVECPLTERSAAWAEKFGVRCEACEEIKRAHMIGIKKLARARAADGR